MGKLYEGNVELFANTRLRRLTSDLIPRVSSTRRMYPSCTTR